MIAVETEEFATEELLQRHPQLREKALIDYVNGLDVADDHIRVREQRSGFSMRLFDSITGRSARRQQQIDQNVQAGLRASLAWLQDLQCQQGRSDLAVAIVADKLTETRDGVMRLQQRVSGFRVEFDALLVHLEVVESEQRERLDAHEQRILRLERSHHVQQHVDHVLSKWRAGQFVQFTPIERLFLVCNELQWGDFGAWLRSPHHGDSSERLLETVRNDLVAQLRQDCGGKDLPLSMQVWMTKELTPESPDQQTLMGYLAADYSDFDNQPLPVLMADRQSAHALNSLQLPRSAGCPKLVHHMLSQTALYRESICRKV